MFVSKRGNARIGEEMEKAKKVEKTRKDLELKHEK